MQNSWGFFLFGWRLCGFSIVKFSLAAVRSIARASEIEHKEKEYALLDNAWCTQSHVEKQKKLLAAAFFVWSSTLRFVSLLSPDGTAVTSEPGRSARRSIEHSWFRIHNS